MQTYVAEVDNWFAACATEDVKESQRDHIDRVVSTVECQVLLRACAILTPITDDTR